MRISQGLLTAVVLGIVVAGCRPGDARPDTTFPSVSAGASAPGAPVAGDGITLPAGGDRGQPDGEWQMPGRDFGASRYSPLAEITRANVGQLKVALTFSTGVLNGHEGQPLVVNNTMYIVTPFPNTLYALDLTKPGAPMKWSYDPAPDARAVGIACCDIVNRGAVYAAGKIVYNTLDAHTVAVDAATGKQLWKTKVGNIDIGETMTMAPLVVRNVVLVGDAGAELGVRGYLAGLDLATGKELWRAYSTGPDRDVRLAPDFKAFYPKDQGTDLGVHSWVGDQWMRGGGTVWGWVTYDPETDLVFYGTANPGVWNPDLRPGDNKWSITLFARDPATGMAKWAYQFVKHDAWDYDEIMENIVVDMPVDGRQRKLLLHPGRTGFMYTFDRTTGELLGARAYQPVNWASGVDLATGEHLVDESKRTHQGVVTRDICPSSTGAKDQQPSAFSPRTGLVYIPAHNVCMNYEGVEANYIAGTPYLGASVKMFPGPGGYRGELVAWDPVRQTKVCGVREDLPLWSGVLATASDLVFYGTMDGWFRAVDARTCETLWSFKTGSGIVGNPIAYRGPDGHQYIAIYSGVGGWMGAVAFPSVSLDDPYTALGVAGAIPDIKKKTAMGGTVYVFSL